MDPLKKKGKLPKTVHHLPVESISDENQGKFVGKLCGKVVSIADPEQANELQKSGCFGESLLHSRLNEGYYEVNGEMVHVEAEKSETLTLNLQEAFFLHHSLKCLTVLNSGDQTMTTDELARACFEQEPEFATSFVAYLFLRARNWVVKSGDKFGCEYLCYKIGPKYYHAKYMVSVRRARSESPKAEFPSKEILAWNRIGETSGKNCIILEVHYPEEFSMASFVQLLPRFKVSCVSLKRLL